MMRHPFMPSLVMTTGVASLAEANGAWWLVDAIVSHIVTGPAKDHAISFWTFERSKRGGFRLLATDGGQYDCDPVTIARQEIEASDYPEGELPARIWVARSEDDRGRLTFVMMLPEEY